MPYSLTFDVQAESTGIAFRARLLDTSGTAVGAERTPTQAYVGVSADGTIHHYLLTITDIPNDHRGSVKFYASGTPDAILAHRSINPEEGELVRLATALLNHNTGLRNATYNANGDLLTVDKILYDSAANAQVDDGVTGVIGTLRETYVYSGQRMTSAKMVRTG